MARPTLPLALGGLFALALSGCMSLKDAEPPESGPYAQGADSTASQEEGKTTADSTKTAGQAAPRGGAVPAEPEPEVKPSEDPVELAEYDEESAGDDADLGGVGRNTVAGSSGLLSPVTTAAPSVETASSTGRADRSIRIARKAEEKRAKAKERDSRRPVAPAVVAPPPASTTPSPVVESNTEDYKDYGINGFTLTERDGLSTFAVDVDTASYTITRRKLREGYLPPAAAVRVEEFVNYFPYEYAQPKAGHPFAVDVEAAPSPYNPQNHIVRIGVQGKKVHFDTRRPVNLTFLVDVSGSMQARDKIGLVKDTLRMLTKELEDGDTVSLVTYAGATKVVLAPTPISQRGRIISALDGLTAGGSTAMGAGIELAYAQAEATYRPGSVNRVIVASDGDANVGITSHSQLSSFIAGKAKKGITLTTLGFGNGNYKDTMMERLANEGDGNYYYIDSMQESRRLFVDQLSSTLEVIAKDVKIQVDWNADSVLAYRLIGYENRDIADRDFRNDAVDAGEIGAGHQVTALYEVALKDELTEGLGTVRIRNKAPGPDSPAVERQYAVPMSVMASRFGESSAQFRIQTAAAGFAEILRGSPHMNEVSLRDVAAIARDARRVEYNEDSELIELIERASQLRGERAVSRR